jgi:dienelactone hydrolase
MKVYLILFLLIYSSISTWGQKRLIDNDTYKKWIQVHSDYKISNDGKFVLYKYGSEEIGVRLVVQAIDGSYKREFSGVSNALLTEDSRAVICMFPHDSMGILNLKNDMIHFYSDVRSFAVPDNGTGQWLVILKNTVEKELILLDLFSGIEKKYRYVEDFEFDKVGENLIVRTDSSLIWSTLQNSTDKVIMRGLKGLEISLDKSSTQIAFIVNNGEYNELRYYKLGMDTAIILVDNQTPGISKIFKLSTGQLRFSPNGKNIFFQLTQNISPEVKSNVLSKDVDIWNYKDEILQSQQLKVFSREGTRTVLGVTEIERPYVYQLDSAKSGAVLYGFTGGDNYLFAKTIIDDYDLKWNQRVLLELVSIKNGSRKLIKMCSDHRIIAPLFSPNEKFVIWFDDKEKNYYSYEVLTGITRNITNSIKVPLFDNKADIIDRYLPFPSPIWLPNDSALLIYDQYDIWKVDPLAKNPVVNITNNYGRVHKIIFRCIDRSDKLDEPNDTLLIAGFNTINKDNGFWKLKLESRINPIQCTMGPYLYYFPSISPGKLIEPSVDLPRKAKKSNVYLVSRKSVTEAPNLYTTTDFKNFNTISNFQPQSEYNWMTSELVRWKMIDGKMSEGILYKPENFDPTKKYPLIFAYYEKQSDGLNMYRVPCLSNGVLNIPWYVSHGYLVFDPDIHYTTGHVGNSAVNAVVSAAEYLSKFPWVDAKRLGLHGHSFGGYQTNYLITHSNLFAAAQETAGMSDLISEYGSINGGGGSKQVMYERSQSNLGTSPWLAPEIYIENSPIFHVQKVKTPLLILHNKGDGNISFTQATEFFTALRRAGKKVWLLQYDNEDHVIYTNQRNLLDFTIRQQQFFGYYLKNELAPKWMTEGVHASRKGIDSGLEFDTSGAIP